MSCDLKPHPLITLPCHVILRGEWTSFFGILKTLFLLHCVPLYVCRLCINYQVLSTNLLGMAALRILLLTFISHFVIDFLSIWKVIILPMIVTPYGHVLYTKMLQIAWRFVSAILRNRGGGGYGKPTAHAHVMMFDPLPVGRMPCRVRRQWSR